MLGGCVARYCIASTGCLPSTSFRYAAANVGSVKFLFLQRRWQPIQFADFTQKRELGSLVGAIGPIQENLVNGILALPTTHVAGWILLGGHEWGLSWTSSIIVNCVALRLLLTPFEVIMQSLRKRWAAYTIYPVQILGLVSYVGALRAFTLDDQVDGKYGVLSESCLWASLSGPDPTYILPGVLLMACTWFHLMHMTRHLKFVCSSEFELTTWKDRLYLKVPYFSLPCTIVCGSLILPQLHMGELLFLLTFASWHLAQETFFPKITVRKPTPDIIQNTMPYKPLKDTWKYVFKRKELESEYRRKMTTRYSK